MKERKLTRDEKKARRNLEKAFQAAHKQQAKAAGWGYLKPTAFKRIGEWFVALHPVIWTDAERAQLWAMVKPFAIDDLMSRILGFDGLDGTPLSLRTGGPYCLVRPMFVKDVESAGDLDRMLSLSSDFAEEVAFKVPALSLDDFIAFTADDVPAGHVSHNQVAAMILANRSDEALALCGQAITSKQWGGPARTTEDGRIVTFFELTERWIRRGRLRLVQ